tara:strand:- start:673 stop:1641 length:969 start_codon:yes stop_codon:yes gene_type:complete
MAKIELPDQTLSDMNDELEKRFDNSRRPHMGASMIGGPCERQIWNQFHFLTENTIGAPGVKAIADGHHSEAVMVERLQQTPGVTLRVEQGHKRKQFSFKDGHLGGSLDGLISGISHLPEVEHVWEHKCVNEKKFSILVRLALLEESSALYNWDQIYFGQAQTYMHYFKKDWHYLTVCTPGSRGETSCVTPYNKDAAQHYIDKAKRIIASHRPPPKISETAAWFQCKFCPFTDNCHGQKLPDVNCRTCAHSTAKDDGSWECELHEDVLSFKDQLMGCGDHLFNPGTVPGNQTDAGEGWIEYEMPDGNTIRNQAATVSTTATAE